MILCNWDIHILLYFGLSFFFFFLIVLQWMGYIHDKGVPFNTKTNWRGFLYFLIWRWFAEIRACKIILNIHKLSFQLRHAVRSSSASSSGLGTGWPSWSERQVISRTEVQSSALSLQRSRNCGCTAAEGPVKWSGCAYDCVSKFGENGSKWHLQGNIYNDITNTQLLG